MLTFSASGVDENTQKQPPRAPLPNASLSPVSVSLGQHQTCAVLTYTVVSLGHRSWVRELTYIEGHYYLVTVVRISGCFSTEPSSLPPDPAGTTMPPLLLLCWESGGARLAGSLQCCCGCQREKRSAHARNQLSYGKLPPDWSVVWGCLVKRCYYFVTFSKTYV